VGVGLKHVAVVGAGILGLCTADELLTRGFRVTVIERDAKPGNGCSHGNGGLIVPSHFEPLAAPGMIAMGLRMLPDPQSPFAIHGLASFEVLSWAARFAMAANHRHVERCSPILQDMHLTSRALYEDTYLELARRSGYEHKGELMICRTAPALNGERRLAERAAKLGMKTRVLSRADLKKEEPKCEIDAEGAVYFEDDAKLNPRVFMKELRRRVTDRGATILDAAEVSEIVTEKTAIRSLKTPGGDVEADEFVLAAGAWTGLLARKLGLNLPLLAGKGYGITVKRPPQMPKLPALLIEGRLAVTPMGDELRFVGTMELERPHSLDVNAARVNGMHESIAQYYPAFRQFDFHEIATWCGLRPCPPDGMPYLGRTKRYENLTFATGHGMMGMSLGPVSGRMVAEAVANEPSSISLEHLSPDRYV
jgi:D-amino-acid dehydrogenase